MNVMPTSRWMLLSSIWRPLRSLRSSAPSGSSSSSTAGRLTSARASATRCCWPPESWRGLRFASARQPDELELVRDAPAHLVLWQRPCGAARTRRCPRRSGAGRAHSSGRRCSSGAGTAAGRRRSRRRAGSGPRSAPRSPRPSAAWSSCRTRSGPSRVKNSPRSNVEVEVAHGREVAEALGDVLQTRRSAVRRPPGRGPSPGVLNFCVSPRQSTKRLTVWPCRYSHTVISLADSG